MARTEDREKLLSRIRKVLALRASPNENEAASAWTRVQTMLAEHNMVLEDLSMDQHDDMAVEFHLETRAENWMRALGTRVAEMYFCIYFFNDAPHRPGKDRHYMAGEKHNVAVARLMFDYILKTIERLADEAEKKAPVRERADQYRASFINACTARICSRIKERIDAARRGDAKDLHGNTLPVLASEYDRKLLETKSYLDQQFGFSEGAKTTSVTTTITNTRGKRDGEQAGNRVGLDTQVGTTNQHKLT